MPRFMIPGRLRVVIETIAFAILVVGLVFRQDIFASGQLTTNTALPVASAQTVPVSPVTTPEVKPDMAPSGVAQSGVSPSGVSPSGVPPSGVAPSGVAPSGTPSNVFALPVVDRPRTRSDTFSAIAQRERDGHFYFDAVADGAHMRMAFDTGASLVSLRAEDAARAGIDLNRLDYSMRTNTANGIGEAAPVTIDTMTVGNITLRNVRASVARPGKLTTNLLGQSFLRRVAGFNVEGNRLILKGGD